MEQENMNQTGTPDVQAEQPTQEASQPTEETTSNTESLKLPERKEEQAEAVSSISESEWKEIVSGDFNDEVREKLRDVAGIPDFALDAFSQMKQMAQEASVYKAEQMLGSKENLEGTLNWAAENLSENEYNALDQQLRGPGWENALMGAYARADKSGYFSGAKTEKKGGQYEPTVSKAGGSGVQPFANQAEVMKDASRSESNPKHPGHKEWLQQHEARLDATRRHIK